MGLRLSVARVRGALFGVALLLVPAVTGAGQSSPVSPPPADLDTAAFVTLLDRLATQARAAGSPADGATLAHSLPATWIVRAGDERFTVPTAPITDALTAAPTPPTSWSDVRTGAAATIEALRDEAVPLTRAGAPPRPHLRGALADVLAAPEFRGRQRYAGLMALVDRFKRWLRSWLPDANATSSVVLPILSYASWAIAGLAFVLLAVLTWRVLGRASRETAARPRPVHRVEPVDARTWAARARAAALAGDAREAVRCAYHAVLHRLDEDGAWTITDARTPREYVRLLPPGDRRQPAVAFVARLFEGTWYGGAEPAIVDAQVAVRSLDDLAGRPGDS